MCARDTHAHTAISLASLSKPRVDRYHAAAVCAMQSSFDRPIRSMRCGCAPPNAPPCPSPAHTPSNIALPLFTLPPPHPPPSPSRQRASGLRQEQGCGALRMMRTGEQEWVVQSHGRGGWGSRTRGEEGVAPVRWVSTVPRQELAPPHPPGRRAEWRSAPAGWSGGGGSCCLG